MLSLKESKERDWVSSLGKFCNLSKIAERESLLTFRTQNQVQPRTLLQGNFDSKETHRVRE